VWRDLSYWLLHHWPHMPSEPMRPHYADQVLLASATLILDAVVSRFLLRMHNLVASAQPNHKQTDDTALHTTVCPCPDQCRTGACKQEWRGDAGMLRAWQRGRTGFPLVDAGMRQLWATGWMQQVGPS
jgi:FAD binding domain of DNA photolyase